MLCLYLIWRLILIYFNPSSPASDSFPSTVGKKKSKIRCYSTGESEVVQSCLILCDPVDCSPPGSSIHGILQARILEWVAISFSRRSSQPRDRNPVSHIGGRCFNLWATRCLPLILGMDTYFCSFLPNLFVNYAQCLADSQWRRCLL